MNIFDKLGNGISQSIDTIIDKNRQYAQLNRLSAVINNETEALNRAYIALGKQYHKILEGNAEAADMSHICAVIESSKLRLKKAQARYDYIQKYGVPGTEKKPPVTRITPDEIVEPEMDVYADDDEDEDITIAYADSLSTPISASDTKTAEEAPAIVISQASIETVSVPDAPKTEPAPEAAEEAAEAPAPQTADTTNDVPLKKAETASELKRKRAANCAKKKATEASDAEVANDGDITPTV